MTKTASIEVRNKNGDKRAVLSLSNVQLALTLLTMSLALILGVGKGMAWVGDVQMERYFNKTAMPLVESKISDRISLHTAQSEGMIQQELAKINGTLTTQAAQIQILLEDRN